MRCDVIAEGVVEAVKNVGLQVPLVVPLLLLKSCGMRKLRAREGRPEFCAKTIIRSNTGAE